MIKEMASWIAAHSSFTIGTTLFEGWWPEMQPDRCSMLSEQAGGSADYYIKDREDKQVMILTRAKNYFEARADAKTLFTLLHGAAGLTFGPILTAYPVYFVISIECVNSPQYLGMDAKNRHMFSTNYTVRFVNAAGS